MKCGGCCDGAGWTTFTPDEARRLGIKGGILEKRHDPQYGEFYRTQYGLCPFFDSGSRKCDIYDLRPSQCRRFVPASEEAINRGCQA